MKRYSLFPILLIISVVLVFSAPIIFRGKLPIPSDTIVGLYHPFRDLYVNEYPRGVPFKNFLVTDPIRQQYPWRVLSLAILKRWELPLWNPYNFSGAPLLGNMQNAALYPLNILFIASPFSFMWSIQVILQILLSSTFIYIYLRNLQVSKLASLLSSIAYGFSGFNIVWLEWNTIGHTGLWLPLVLLSIDKIFYYSTTSNISYFKFPVLNLKYSLQNVWNIIYLLALVSSFFAGHLQIFFYLFIVQFFYLLLRWIQNGRSRRLVLIFTFHYLLFTVFTSIQWIPAVQFIGESARAIDLDWQKVGWFIPWQHFIQFIIPDFFGNPATLNYWGVWNYGEFVGYIGIFPLMMAIYALFFRYDKKTLFFGFVFFLSLVFSLPTFFARLPFILNIPFLSTAQPTRLLYIIDFSLAVLAGLGLDYYIKNKSKLFYILAFFAVLFGMIFSFIFFLGNTFFYIQPESLYVARRNIYLPFLLFIISAFLLLASLVLQRSKNVLLILLLFVTVFDLLRFANKFTPFTSSEYLYPQAKALSYIQDNVGYSRIMSTDSRIFPPNFSILYKIQSIDGYDPLYLRRYGELIAVSERGKPDINPPFGFNRIITPQRYDSRIIDLMGVKYILSLTDIGYNTSSHYIKVFQEGETRVYSNTKALPRVFFVENVIAVSEKNEAINKMFDKKTNLAITAVVEFDPLDNSSITSDKWSFGQAEIDLYTENEVIIKTRNSGDGFLVFTDAYYPSWHAVMDDKIKLNIYRTDYNFRGVLVPKGDHEIKFYTTLF